MSKPLPPCKDCPNRTMGCHSTCELFKDYELAKQKYYEERDKSFKEIDRYKTKFSRGQR